jgi:hypothetical protein
MNTTKKGDTTMQSDVTCEVHHVFDLTRAVLSDTFSFNALADFTALCRKKPLRIEEETLPVAITGYCVALQDTDLICTRRGLDAILTITARLHEIAHLLLGHIPALSMGAATSTYAAFMHHRDLSSVLYRAHASAYEVPCEYAAETLATLLLKCIFREQHSMPQLARELYS